jgi:ribA/ribD-fused uncharacterized protein
MAGGYLLQVNGIRILTSEALYQACRFPHLPEVQRQIIAERSPMTAKMKSKPYRDNSRPDWDIVRTKIMRWCLQVKLVQNWNKFSGLLLETGDLPIVEDSRKDDFWGAKPKDEETLVGINALGRLLMQLREQVKDGIFTHQTIVNPPSIPDFLLYQEEIKPISKNDKGYSSTCINLLESEDIYSFGDSISIDIDKNSTNSPKHDLFLEQDICSSLISKQNLIEATESEFDEYDSLQFILPHLIESLQDSERTDKELAALFKVNQTQMREWLKRAVQSRKIKKLSSPVRYVAESQLPLIALITTSIQPQIE